MNFRRYTRMKNSGIKWIGDVPEHWDITPLKHVVSCLDGRRVPLNAEQRSHMQGDIPYWGANGIVDYVNDWLFDEVLVLLGEDGAPFLDPLRDVAFTVEGKVWVNNHIHVLRPGNKVNHRFLMHALNAVDYYDYIDGSTRDKLTQSNMNRIRLPLPPKSEQDLIASFLDKKTQAIDTLIETKLLLVDRLQEYRQALITQAVTRGLDPNVPMKDSGIPWIGAIPQHWTVTRIRHGALLIQVGSTPPTDVEEYYEDGSIPWYGPSSSGDDIEISEPVKMIHESALRDGKARKLPPGTTLVVTIGATIGKTGYLAREGCTNQQITGIVPRPSVYPRFLAYYCRSLEPLIRSIAPNTTLPILNQEKVGSLPLLLPPREEQQVIAEYLDRKLTSITSLAGQLTSQIQFLQEYRQALITAAVTGKIDVRQEVQEHAG